MSFNRAAFIARYCDEAEDHLKVIDETLVALEATPGEGDLVAGALRAMHTLKGASRMLKVTDVGTVAHAAEDLLVAARDGAIALGPGHISLLLHAADRIREIVAALREGREGGFAVADLTADLQATAMGAAPRMEAPPDDQPGSAVPAAPSQAQGSLAAGSEAAAAPGRAMGQDQVAAIRPAALPAESPPEETPPKAAPRRAADDTVRVPVSKLDQTIRLMEELASGQLERRHRIAELRRLRGDLRKVLSRVAAAREAHWLESDLADILVGLDHQVREERDMSGQLERLTAALQQQALEIRLMPIGELFGTLPRAVRDIAGQLGKRVRLELGGLDIELDKRVLDGLRAPLVHLVRNAIDHGVEPPDQRRASNKEAEARLSVRAIAHGGKVEIAVEDDGRGIDVELVRRAGLARGLLAPERAEIASEREVLQLLFLAGFSTAREVTDLSGRGVGLDVVKSHIEDLKGDVAVETTEGRGTLFRLTVPVSLTLQTVLRARADNRVYGFPHSFVEETRPIGHLDLIEVAGQPALRLGNQLIPVVDLAETLGLSTGAKRRVVVIGQAAGERVAFGVDAVEEIEEVVIKPVPRGIRSPLVGGFCTAAHGDVVPVLHVPSLIKAVWTMGSRRAASRQALREPRRILVVDDSPNTREVVRIILESAGYLVDTAKDGEDALVRVTRRPYHLVVSDIEMPRLDGFGLCKRIRDQALVLPIILVTSRATEADRRRGAEVGASAYIEKGSFDQDNLIRAVREVLAESLPPP